MNVITHSLALTAHEARPLKHAALGAARIAADAGNGDLSDKIMARARTYNRVARREGGKGTPALPVPDVKTMQDTRPLDAAMLAIVAELARMGRLAEWRIVGSTDADDKPFRPLIARQDGDSVRFMRPADPTPATPVKAKKTEPVKAKKTEPGKVQQTNIADMPEGTRELVKAAKDAGQVSKEWTEIKTVEWDGAKVRIFARLLGKSVRYGIAA